MLRMKLPPLLLIAAVLAIGACHPGPVINTGPDQGSVGGTIAGIVSRDTKDPVPGRRVTAINLQTGARFEATTAVNGGYTIKVPEGRYRLELELREGEIVAKHPGETRVENSDLDPRRDFVVTIR